MSEQDIQEIFKIMEKQLWKKHRVFWLGCLRKIRPIYDEIRQDKTLEDYVYALSCQIDVQTDHLFKIILRQQRYQQNQSFKAMQSCFQELGQAQESLSKKYENFQVSKLSETQKQVHRHTPTSHQCEILKYGSHLSLNIESVGNSCFYKILLGIITIKKSPNTRLGAMIVTLVVTEAIQNRKTQDKSKIDSKLTQGVIQLYLNMSIIFQWRKIIYTD